MAWAWWSSLNFALSRTLKKIGVVKDQSWLQGQKYILGALAKLRKATISFVMSVCLSVRLSAWYNSAVTGRIFTKFDRWVFFGKKNCHENSNFIKIEKEKRKLYKKTDQEGNKLQRQKILSFIYPIYNHNWRNISTIYIYNKTSIKRNILTIEQNSSGSRLKTYQHLCIYIHRGADKSLARPGRKQSTATEDFDVYISYL